MFLTSKTLQVLKDLPDLLDLPVFLDQLDIQNLQNIPDLSDIPNILAILGISAIQEVPNIPDITDILEIQNTLDRGSNLNSIQCLSHLWIPLSYGAIFQQVFRKVQEVPNIGDISTLPKPKHPQTLVVWTQFNAYAIYGCPFPMVPFSSKCSKRWLNFSSSWLPLIKKNYVYKTIALSQSRFRERKLKKETHELLRPGVFCVNLGHIMRQKSFGNN